MGDEDLTGWKFDVDEVSNGVWHGKGVDLSGRSVEASGHDGDALLAKLKQWAREIQDDKPANTRRRKLQH